MNIFLSVLGVLFVFIIVGKVYRRKQAKNKILHVVENNCTGCQRCVKRCRRNALELVKDGKGRYVVLDPDKCTICGNCVPLCKFNALEIIDRN